MRVPSEDLISPSVAAVAAARISCAVLGVVAFAFTLFSPAFLFDFLFVVVILFALSILFVVNNIR